MDKARWLAALLLVGLIGCAPAPRGLVAIRPPTPALEPTSAPPVEVDQAVAPTGIKPKLADTTAARVGDEIITKVELDQAIREWTKANVPEGQTIPREALDPIAARVLAELIDQKLVLQEARRLLKDPKKWDQLAGLSDEKWRDEERDGWLRRTGARSESDLAVKLEQQGDSLAAVKARYRDKSVMQEYLRIKIGPRLRVNLPEMREWYEKHKADESFRSDARVTWRELAIDPKKAGSPARARQQIESLRQQLASGADFAALAVKHSQGATARDGGKWETRPGGYAVAEVEQALANLPVGQISPIIESKDGFHLVLVEKKDSAKVKTFADAQDQARAAVFQEKVRTESESYLERLRAEAPVSTIFEGTASDPMARKVAHPAH